MMRFQWWKKQALKISGIKQLTKIHERLRPDLPKEQAEEASVGIHRIGDEIRCYFKNEKLLVDFKLYGLMILFLEMYWDFCKRKCLHEHESQSWTSSWCNWDMATACRRWLSREIKKNRVTWEMVLVVNLVWFVINWVWSKKEREHVKNNPRVWLGFQIDVCIIFRNTESLIYSSVSSNGGVLIPSNRGSLEICWIGEGNGNPLQCSCLENPRDSGAWWAAVYGVAQSWTRLKQLSCSSSRDLLESGAF